jgi:TonB-dependent starch-binding outer membrane protein SusC
MHDKMMNYFQTKKIWLYCSIILLVMLQSMNIHAQITITGKIIDAYDGSTLPGATVQIRGTNMGSVTDVNGNYKIEVPSNESILVFKFVGYNDEEYTVGNRSELNVSLMPTLTRLNEVVVTGFGTQIKRELTGSIGTISSEEILQVNNNTFQNSIQGAISGVSVTGTSGALGTPSFVRIRGIGSLNSSGDPLYILDGVVIQSYPISEMGSFGATSNFLASINPADIESVEILKDASAAAIYGSRGANGVIIITTKGGKKGATEYDFQYEQGSSNPTRTPHMSNTNQFLRFLQDAWDNAGNTGILPLQRITGSDNPWFTDSIARTIDNDNIGRLYQQGELRNANLSIRGGDEKMVFFINGSFRDEQGIVVRNSLQRVSGRANVEYQASKRLRLGVNFNSSYNESSVFPVSNTWYGKDVMGTYGTPTGLHMQNMLLPYFPNYNPDGSYFLPDQGINPETTKNKDFYDRTRKYYNTITNLIIKYNFNDNFSLQSDLGYNYLSQWEDHFMAPYITQSNPGTGADGYVTFSTRNSYGKSATNFLTYTNTFGDHGLTAMVGIQYSDGMTVSSNMIGMGFPQTTSLRSIENATHILSKNQNEDGAVFASGFTRVNYKYKDRYLLTASYRADGSSRFGQNNRWGYFPGISGGWIISDEDFLAGNSLLTFLKIRGGWGKSGNAEIAQQSPYHSYRIGEFYGGSTSIVPLRLLGSTSNIHWEESAQTDIALEYQLWEGRISGSLGYYTKHNKHLLVPKFLPPSTGVSATGNASYLVNIGELRNSGYEFDITAHVFSKKPVRWRINANFAYLENEVISLGGLQPETFNIEGVGQPIVGGPIASYYMVKWLGVDPQTGNDMFEDPATGAVAVFSNPNNPSQIELERLRQPIEGKSGLPTYTGGLSNSLDYKGINLSFLFTYTVGQYVYDHSGRQQSYAGTGQHNAYPWITENYWKNPGDITNNSKPYWNQSGLREVNSTKFLYDASFVRLRNITLSYELPRRWMRTINVKGLQIYAAADNLLTFTRDYPLWDPEVVNPLAQIFPMAGNVLPGATKNDAPQARMIRMGMKVKI